MKWLKERKQQAEKRKSEKVPAKKKSPSPVLIVKDPPVVTPPEGPTCHCGKPVAPGQTYVCLEHIRRT